MNWCLLRVVMGPIPNGKLKFPLMGIYPDAVGRKQTPKQRKVSYENLAGRSQGRNRLEIENPFEDHGASTPWPSHDIREGKGGSLEACQVPRLDTMGRCSRRPPDRRNPHKSEGPRVANH